jgi:Ca-activated chloride channel family protein
MSELHLLRPWWLLLLLLAPLPLLLDHRRRREAGGWRGVVAPHLLDALLVVEGTRSRLRPALLASAMLAVLALCLAGPTWRHEPSPFVTDSATMVVALDLSRGAVPALEPGKRKIRDLVAARGGGRTGIVAYAGTAHAVLPPTDDARLIETYLDALVPEIMPRDGNAAAAAATAALRVLDAEPGAGTLVLVTPAVPAVEAGAFTQAMRGSRHAALILATGPGPFEGAPGAGVVERTPDGADIARVIARAQRHFAAAPSDDPTMRWQDAGPWLALLLVPLALPWARRGMLVAAVVILPARAAEAGWFERLWLTSDQQARIMLERGDPAGAAELFTDPVWRGIALYRAGNYEGAATAFALRDTAEAQYDRGNALMMQPRGWDDAIPAYDRALQLRPDFPEARTNRAVAIAFRTQWQAAQAQRAENQTDQEQKPGEDTQIDQTPPNQHPPQDDADPNRAAGQGLSDDQIQGMWMRRVGGTPRDFLRLRFARQAQR